MSTSPESLPPSEAPSVQTPGIVVANTTGRFRVHNPFIIGVLASGAIVLLALICLIILNTVTRTNDIKSSLTTAASGEKISLSSKISPALPLHVTSWQLEARQHNGAWKPVPSQHVINGNKLTLTTKALDGKVAYRVVPKFIGIPGTSSKNIIITGAFAVLRVHLTGVPAGKQARVLAFSQQAGGRQTITKDAAIPVTKASTWSFVMSGIDLDKGAMQWSKTPNIFASVKKGDDKTVTLSYDLYLDAADTNEFNAAATSQDMQAVPQFYKAHGISVTTQP